MAKIEVTTISLWSNQMDYACTLLKQNSIDCIRDDVHNYLTFAWRDGEKAALLLRANGVEYSVPNIPERPLKKQVIDTDDTRNAAPRQASSGRVFTDEEKGMLLKPLPKDPCTKCGMKESCCGCPEAYAYKDAVQPYKDAGLYKLALAVAKRRSLVQRIAELTDELEEMDNGLPDFIVNM